MLALKADYALTTLLLERAGLRSTAASRFGDPAADDDADCSSAELDGALSALLEIGAIQTEDADRWRKRYLAVGSDRAAGRPVPIRIRDRALELLQGAQGRYDPAAPEDQRMWVIFDARMAAEAFRGAGIISPEEWVTWYSGFDRLLGISYEPEDLIHGPQLTKVVRVLGGPDQAAADIRLTRIELYDDGFAVYWRGRAYPEEDEDEDESDDDESWFVEVDIADDIGTVYEDYGSAGNGAGGVETGGEVFGPAVPQSASVLHVTIGGARFEVRT